MPVWLSHQLRIEGEDLRSSLIQMLHNEGESERENNSEICSIQSFSNSYILQ